MNIDTKEKLIAAGIKLMLGGGFSSTGIKDIVERAGVPKGSFYYYFDSKDTYAAEVIDRYAENAVADRAAILRQSEVAPLERLRQSFEAYYRYYTEQRFEEGCLLGNLSVDIGDRNDAVRMRLQAAFKLWENDIRAMLEEARQQGELPANLDPERTAAFLLNAWEGAIVRMKTEQDGGPLNNFLEFYDHLLS